MSESESSKITDHSINLDRLRFLPDLMVRSTVRIEGRTFDPESKQLAPNISRSTAFVFAFDLEGGARFPVLVTCRHAVEGRNIFNFAFHAEDKDRKPLPGGVIKLNDFRLDESWVFHPNPDIDLAVLPIGHWLHQLRAGGMPVHLSFISESMIPSTSEIERLAPIEDIITVGYPKGVWDERNNMPISRRGVTATSCTVDYEGRPEFLIDIATFDGSSGRPAFLYKDVVATSKTNDRPIFAKVFYLLGIVHQTRFFMEDVPLVSGDEITQAKARMPIYLHLGRVQHSRVLLDFKPLILNGAILVKKKADGVQ